MQEESEPTASIREHNGSGIAFAFDKGDSFLTLNSFLSTLHQEEWVCTACSYQNVDVGNAICSVCGQDRNDEPRILELSSSTLSSGELKMPATTSELHSLQSQDERSSTTKSFSPDPSKMTEKPSLGDTHRSKGQQRNSCHCKSTNQVGYAITQQEKSTTETSPTAPPAAKKEKTWTCSLCTFTNTNHLHLVCQVCGHKRDHSLYQGQEKVCQEGPSSSVSMLEQETFLQKQTRLSEDDELKALQKEQLEELVALQAKLFQELEENQDSADGDNQSGAGASSDDSPRPNTHVSRCA